MPELAGQIARSFARSKAGEQVGAGCLSAEPTTGAESEFKVTNVKVTAANPHAATPGRTTGTVSFKNFGKLATVRFELRRTPDGWQIDDLRAGTNPSLRAQMAACEAGGK